MSGTGKEGEGTKGEAAQGVRRHKGGGSTREGGTRGEGMRGTGKEGEGTKGGVAQGGRQHKGEAARGEEAREGEAREGRQHEGKKRRGGGPKRRCCTQSIPGQYGKQQLRELQPQHKTTVRKHDASTAAFPCGDPACVGRGFANVKSGGLGQSRRLVRPRRGCQLRVRYSRYRSSRGGRQQQQQHTWHFPNISSLLCSLMIRLKFTGLLHRPEGS